MGKEEISVWAISYGFWPVFSGAAIQAGRLYRALSKENFSFTVLTGHHEEAKSSLRKDCLDGIAIYRIPLFPELSKSSGKFRNIQNLLNDILFVMICSYHILINRGTIDVLHIHGLSRLMPLLAPICKALGIPVIIKLTMLHALQDVSVRGLGKKVYSKARIWGLHSATRVIVLNIKMFEECVDAGLDVSKVELIRQGVDTTIFSPLDQISRNKLTRKLGLQPGGVKVAFVGSILYRKGVDLLVEAFLSMAQSSPDLQLLIIGQDDFSEFPSPSNREKLVRFVELLKNKIQHHGFEDRVVWTGKCEPGLVANYLQVSDLFVFPSRLEGAPSAVLEAMSTGLPVIVSSLNGTACDSLTNGVHGFIVEDEQPQNYAENIGKLISDKEKSREFGKNARIQVIKRYSFDSTVESYRALYSSLASDQL